MNEECSSALDANIRSNLMYKSDLSSIYLIMIFGVLFWTAMQFGFQKKKRLRMFWKSMNFIGVLIAINGILSYTVLHRTPSANHQFVWYAEIGDEFYREMLMNAFLYYPFGLTLSTLIGPVSILIAFILSLTIESWQYFAGTGLAQGTDVIMNTLGCAIGTIPWFIVRSGLVEKIVTLIKKITGSIKKQ